VAAIVTMKRRAQKSVEAAYPDALVVDVTSRADEPWVYPSPFFPHGAIPVPVSRGVATLRSKAHGKRTIVRDVDAAKLAVTTMTGLKRTARRFGPVLGHRRGIHDDASPRADLDCSSPHIASRSFSQPAKLPGIAFAAPNSVGIPRTAAGTRLIGAVLTDQTREWTEHSEHLDCARKRQVACGMMNADVVSRSDPWTDRSFGADALSCRPRGGVARRGRGHTLVTR
jgi:uncharacterized protein DUF6939